jgi:ethanolamine utilization cobalamin adenosyltransferase
MIVTEADLRDQLRRPDKGAQVIIPAGAKLSPSAADFVKQWGLATVEAAPHEHSAAPDPGEWDTASTFPVDVTGERPRCTTCGSPVTEKASALTQLNSCHYAPKTHPRIRLRGRVDSLHALVLLVQRIAREQDQAELTADLGTVAAFCRELTSAEYNERPAAELVLHDWDAEQIHDVTHDPKGTLGIDHLTIDEDEPELQHWLNLARTTAREIEITALDAFPSPHHPYGASICYSFNRLSSVFYFFQLRLKAGSR